MPDFTAASLLAAVKKRFAIPAGQPGYSDSDISQTIIDVLQDDIQPDIITVSRDSFVTTSDTAISTSTTTSYAIPSGALGNLLREVKAFDPNDAEDQIDVPRRPFGSREVYSDGFYFQGNAIFVLNDSGTYNGRTLRLYYYREIDDPEDAEVPTQAREALICGAIARIAGGIDPSSLQFWESKYQQAREKMKELLSDRSVGEPENIYNDDPLV